MSLHMKTLDIRRHSVRAVCRVIELSCPRQLVLKGPGGMYTRQMFDFRLFEVVCLLIGLQVA